MDSEIMAKLREAMEVSDVLCDRIDEMELSGERTCWHGSFNAPPLDTSKNAENLGSYPCFFFTSHFGYAVQYIYQADVSDLKFYRQFPKFVNEIDATGMDLIGTSRTGYLYPLKLAKGANIYDSYLAGDVHRMVELIGQDKELNDIFMKHKKDKFEFCNELAKSDWFNLERPSSEMSIYGIKRNQILDLLHSRARGVVFHGFSNYEYDAFHSIGLFKDKIPDYLKQTKPLKVSFHKDLKIKEKNKYTGKVEEVVKDLITINYEKSKLP